MTDQLRLDVGALLAHLSARIERQPRVVDVDGPTLRVALGAPARPGPRQPDHWAWLLEACETAGQEAGK